VGTASGFPDPIRVFRVYDLAGRRAQNAHYCECPDGLLFHAASFFPSSGLAAAPLLPFTY
jgi:hypothetical protein